MEMGLRNRGSSEPHIDPSPEQGSTEETKLSTSSDVPGKTRRSALLSVLAATKFRNRQQGNYKPLDSSHEQGETQESGGQAWNIHENPQQAQILGSGHQAEDQESPPRRAENEENPWQAENQVRLGQAVTQGSREVFGKTSRSYIRMKHKALIDQLNSCAVLLVLVAGAMSVAVLQPPGSFDTDGYIREAAEPYLFAASLSFLFAMFGLVLVMLVFVKLFDPMFYAPPRTDDTLDGSATSGEIEIIEGASSKLGRVFVYLGFSLISCLFAFALGLGAVSSRRIFLVFGFGILISIGFEFVFKLGLKLLKRRT